VPASFISAGAVGGGRPIVVMLVGSLPGGKHTGKRRKNITRRQRAGRRSGVPPEGYAPENPVLMSIHRLG